MPDSRYIVLVVLACLAVAVYLADVSKAPTTPDLSPHPCSNFRICREAPPTETT